MCKFYNFFLKTRKLSVLIPLQTTMWYNYAVGEVASTKVLIPLQTTMWYNRAF